MTEIQKAKINNELVCEEEDDSSSEDEEPSFLKVMVEKQEDVEVSYVVDLGAESN